MITFKIFVGKIIDNIQYNICKWKGTHKGTH